jgi:hypothetical protein
MTRAKSWTAAVALVLASAFVASCAERPYSRRDRDRWDRSERYDREDDAFDIVRADPCRYDQYKEFAREHKNPNKRRRYVERLAREGCHGDDRRSDRDDDRDRDRRRYDRDSD